MSAGKVSLSGGQARILAWMGELGWASVCKVTAVAGRNTGSSPERR